MSEDSYTEVTNQSWFSRIGGAFKGIIFGFIFFLVAFPLLFWNEGRAVKTYKTLKEGGGAVVSVSADRVDSTNAGKLIHLSGEATTEATLTDPIFGVSADALKLRRNVEMYQWWENSTSETKKKLGGGTETVTEYSYGKSWSEQVVSSANFNKSAEHENPVSMPYTAADLTADRIMVGAFTLSPSLVGAINNFAPLAVGSDTAPPEELRGRATQHNGGFYLGENPASPQVGDVRIQFAIVSPTDVSVIAKQVKDSFEAYQAKAGGTIEILQIGVHTAEAMIQKAQTDNKIMTWILRFVGFVLMLIGLNMIFKVLSVIADVLPILGGIVGAGTGIISFLIASLLSLITIAVAWIVFRPLLGILLLAVAIGLIVLVINKVKVGKNNAAPLASPPPPPPGA
jgi:hypothetical protein